MGDVFVLVEHRQGKIRDITFEMLGIGEKIAQEKGLSTVAVLLGHGIKGLAERLPQTIFLVADGVPQVDLRSAGCSRSGRR